jgi:hypothetical protein
MTWDDIRPTSNRRYRGTQLREVSLVAWGRPSLNVSPGRAGNWVDQLALPTTRQTWPNQSTTKLIVGDLVMDLEAKRPALAARPCRVWS